MNQQESLTGLQKAAALLATLGEEASARIIKQLKEDEIKKSHEKIEGRMRHMLKAQIRGKDIT